jgi:hypothetical protein
MSFKIDKTVNFIGSDNVEKNLATEMAKIGTGGGSTVTASATNGHININGTDTTVYDDTTIKNQFSTLEVRTSDPSTPAVGRMWLRSDL